jgi:uncharacterized protein YgbK (DUF1537 family)
MVDADDGVPPTARIAVLSDDLTGANGVAAAFASHGARAFTSLGPAPLMAPPDVAVLVVDTATRDAAPAAAAEAIRTAANAVQAWGARLLAKRIDTTLRGCIAAETAALLDVLAPDTLAVLVPAAPDAGRACVGGRVFLDGQPVSAVTNGPDEPLRLFAAQAPALAAVGCPLATVRRGPDAVRAALRQAAASGARVVVCDAETTADVTTLATAVAGLAQPVLPVDPGGFTLALSRALGLGTGTEPRAADADAGGWPPHGRILAVLGSPAAVTSRQIETAVARGWLTRLPVNGTALAAGDDVARHEVARALTALSTASTPVVGIDPSPRGEQADLRRVVAVARGLAAIVAAAMTTKPPVLGLYLTGGTVARAVLERLGAHGVWVEQEVVPLAALGRIADGPYAGLAVVTKGGMVGGTDALVRCLAALGTVARRPAEGIRPLRLL